MRCAVAQGADVAPRAPGEPSLLLLAPLAKLLVELPLLLVLFLLPLRTRTNTTYSTQQKKKKKEEM